MKKEKLLRIFVLIGIVSFVLFCTSILIDTFLETPFKYRELIFKIIEIVFASSTSFSFSASITINVYKNIKNTEFNESISESNINAVNADGKNVIINIHNDNPLVTNQLIAMSKRIDDVEKANVEKIVGMVINKVGDKETKAIDDDFIMKFLYESKNISNEEMQNIWASLMASSITTDNRVTRRTLDIVKNLSPDEARLFETIAGLSLENGVICKEFVKNVPFIDLSLLQDIGLLKTGESMSINYDVNPKERTSIKEGNILLLINNTSDSDKKIQYGCHVLTNEGLQLKKAINIALPEDKIIEFGKYLKTIQPSGIEITMHRIIHIYSDGRINYLTDDILIK